MDDASFVVAPENANYVFVPSTQTVSLASNQTGLNFRAYRKNAIVLGQALGGSLNLIFAGNNGQSFRVEASANMLNWTPATTNTIGANGLLEISVPVATSGSRFFRLVSP